MLEEKYPEYIIAILRERNGLDEDDPSIDAELLELSPQEVFNEVCTWEGFIGYGSTILGWVDDIFGTDLQDGDNFF